MMCKDCKERKAKKKGLCQRCYVHRQYAKKPKIIYEDGLAYDPNGRMYFDYDEAKTLSFALGKTEAVCRQKALQFKKNGMFEYYRNEYLKKLEG